MNLKGNPVESGIDICGVKASFRIPMGLQSKSFIIESKPKLRGKKSNNQMS